MRQLPIKRLTIRQRFAKFWEHEGSFTVLLVVLLVQIFVILPYFPKGGFEQYILPIFYFLLLVTGLISVAENNQRLVIILCSIAAVAQISARFLLKTQPQLLFSDFFYALFCSALASVVLIRTLGKGPITIKRIEGSIVVYLLFALAFALVFHAIFLLKGEGSFSGLRSRQEDEFLYFSITTLTTTGYGDISPSAIAARSFANLESLIGQLYPAILIARLVSMQLMSVKRDD